MYMVERRGASIVSINILATEAIGNTKDGEWLIRG